MLADAYDARSNSIGAIRLACALAVIIGHASPFGGYGDTWLMELTNQQVSGARLAVDIFFILSGFLLAGSVEKGSLLEYSRNRFLRIFPGLWACLIVTGVIVPLLFGVAPGIQYVTKNAWLLGGVHSGIPGLFQDNPFKNANGALWTLTWELYCYISLVGLALFGRYRRIVASAVFLGVWLAFALKIGEAASLEAKAAITSPFRLFAFFYSGVLLWLFRDRVPLRAAGAIVAGLSLIAAATVGTMTFHKPGGLFYVVAPAVLGYLVIYAAVRLPFTQLNARTDISYGLYIYGTFVIQVLAALGVSAQLGNYPAFATVCVLATWPLSWLSWRYVERPAMSLRRSTPPQLQVA